MKLKICVFTLLVYLGCTAAASAQNFEYGTVDELNGLTTYYVETYGNVDARNKIVAEIGKELPGLKLLDDIAPGCVRLGFQSGVQNVVGSVTVAATTAIVNNDQLATGVGVVWLDAHGTDPLKIRIVLNSAHRRDNKIEKLPSVRFALDFIKAYKKANGLK